MIQEDPRERTLLARGQGGAAISEVVNLWKGNWPVGKGVNDVDWGVAGGSPSYVGHPLTRAQHGTTSW